MSVDQTMPRLMLAFERNYFGDLKAEMQVHQMCRAYREVGFKVEIAVVAEPHGVTEHLTSLRSVGVDVVALGDVGLSDEGWGSDGRLSKRLLELAHARGVSVLMPVGYGLAVALSADTSSRSFLWSMCWSDFPTRDVVLPEHAAGLLTKIGKGSRRLVFPNESLRSAAEGLVPTLAGRTLALPEDDGSEQQALGRMFPRLISRPPRNRTAVANPPIRAVVVGSDFKFAGDLVQALHDSPLIAFDSLQLASSTSLDEDAVRSACANAEVIIAEFATPNAVWLSKNLRSDQRLIVHLHGYELRSAWIDELDIERTERVVLPSEFYLEEAVGAKGWPREKLAVIPNGVDFSDLARPKLRDARFHLGLVGYVPYLKRPERAVAVLRYLLDRDDRYYLHFKGHDPWRYSWEWKKPRNQDAYRQFYDSIGREAELLAHVSFEPFSPDVGNWLRKIGWVLSPSVRETFHLAPMEGAASGAVPAVWRREGSADIFSERFTFDNAERVAEYILRVNNDEAGFEQESLRAQALAATYDANSVRDRWQTLVYELGCSARERAPQVVDLGNQTPSEALLADRVLELMFKDRWDEALRLLDENISTTASAKGALKDLELFVRGLFELDTRRFGLLLPLSEGGREGSDSGVQLNVRAYGSSNLADAAAGIDDLSIDIRLRATLARALGHSMADDDDIQIDRAHYTVNYPFGMRFDRWVEYAAAACERVARDEGAERIVTSGPWWIALVSAVAASRVDIPFAWSPRDPSSQALVEAAATNRWSVNPVVGLVGAVCTAAPIRHKRVEEARFVSSERPWVTYGMAKRAREDMRLGFVGTAAQRSAYERSWRVSMSPMDPLGEFMGDAWLDAIVVDGSSVGAGSADQQAGAVKGLIALSDRARAFGVPTIWLGDGAASSALLPAIRKADVLVDHRDVLKRVLVLNPISTRSVVIRSPHGVDVTAALRAAGVAVAADVEPHRMSERVPRSHEAPDADAYYGLDSDGHESSTDGVSVVIATHGGEARLGEALQSIARQSLPAELIEVVIVENGAPDRTRDVVKAFMESHPNINTRYEWQEPASAGLARNRGIEIAGMRYITFLDDDDVLGRNYLYSMWLTAAEDVIVAGRLDDLLPDGSRVYDTPTNARHDALGSGLVPVRNRAGLLSLNAAKLIPASRLHGIRYPDLASGEDIVFMAGLLGYADLYFAASARMADDSYVRRVREGSISRQEDSFEFSVVQRLKVMAALQQQIGPTNARSGGKAGVEYLADGQRRFIRQHLARNPAARSDALAIAAGLGVVSPF